MPSTGPGAWITGQGGVGPSGGPGVSDSSSSGGPPARGGAKASAVAAAGSASSSVVPSALVVAVPLIAAAEALGLPAPCSPAASTASSESGSGEVHPDIPVLQRECDLARGHYLAASVEVDHLRESLRVVKVARGAAEEEARAARDAAVDAQPGPLVSSILDRASRPATHTFYP